MTEWWNNLSHNEQFDTSVESQDDGLRLIRVHDSWYTIQELGRWVRSKRPGKIIYGLIPCVYSEQRH